MKRKVLLSNFLETFCLVKRTRREKRKMASEDYSSISRWERFAQSLSWASFQKLRWVRKVSYFQTKVVPRVYRPSTSFMLVEGFYLF